MTEVIILSGDFSYIDPFSIFNAPLKIVLNVEIVKVEIEKGKTLYLSPKVLSN